MYKEERRTARKNGGLARLMGGGFLSFTITVLYGALQGGARVLTLIIGGVQVLAMLWQSLDFVLLGDC